MSNPPRLATRPATGFEDREALRDLTTPGDKDTRMRKVKQGQLKGRSAARRYGMDQGAMRVLLICVETWPMTGPMGTKRRSIITTMQILRMPSAIPVIAQALPF